MRSRLYPVRVLLTLCVPLPRFVMISPYFSTSLCSSSPCDLFAHVRLETLARQGALDGNRVKRLCRLEKANCNIFQLLHRWFMRAFASLLYIRFGVPYFVLWDWLHPLSLRLGNDHLMMYRARQTNVKWTSRTQFNDAKWFRDCKDIETFGGMPKALCSTRDVHVLTGRKARTKCFSHP